MRFLSGGYITFSFGVTYKVVVDVARTVTFMLRIWFAFKVNLTVRCGYGYHYFRVNPFRAPKLFSILNPK